MNGAVLLGPMFRVDGKERRSEEIGPTNDTVAPHSFCLVNPEFRLVPTRSYYMLVGCGVLLTVLPLLSRTIWLALLMSSALFLCGITLIQKIWRIEKMCQPLGSRRDLICAIPYTQMKRQAALWLLCVFPIAVIELLLCLVGFNKAANWMNTSTEPSHWLAGHLDPKSIWHMDSGLGVPILLCILFWAIFSHIWIRYSPSFRLSELEGRYRAFGETFKEKVTHATRSKSVVTAQTWRVGNNVAQQIHLFGHAIAFFSVHIEGAVWKRSLRALVWYYAPISVPFVILMVLPILVLAQGLFAYMNIPFSTPERYEFALSTVAWASWSICTFIFISERDFGNRDAYDMEPRPVVDVDVLELGDDAKRQVLKQYLADRGQVVMHILILALMPMLLTYFGLYPEPSPPEKPTQSVTIFQYVAR